MHSAKRLSIAGCFSTPSLQQHDDGLAGFVEERVTSDASPLVAQVLERLIDLREQAGFVVMAAAAQKLNRVADLIDDVGLNAFGRLVEDEDLRLGEQRAADGELLLLAAGEHAAFARQKFLQDREEAEDAVERCRSAFLPSAMAPMCRFSSTVSCGKMSRPCGT